MVSYPDSPLTAMSLDQLRRRTSAKWQLYSPEILPLWVAEMDVPLAEPIRARLHEAVDLGDTGYPMAGGLPAAYSGFVKRRFGWDLAPDQVAVVPDVVQGIASLVELLTEPGDGVVINPPVYPPFFSCLRSLRRVVVECPLVPVPSGAQAGRWELNLEQLERCFAQPGVRAYLMCDPHNPTGTVFTEEELRQVARLAERYRIQVIVDEIHAPLTYPGHRHVPFGSLAEDCSAAASAFSVSSATKAWNLAGLKAAVIAAGPAAAGKLGELPEAVLGSCGIFGVLASETAFDRGERWLDELLVGLDANRRLLAQLLAEQLPNVGYWLPEGTYLAWLDCRKLDFPTEPARYLRNAGQVALYPGPSFGSPGEGFVRFNLACHPLVLAEAVERMAKVFG